MLCPIHQNVLLPYWVEDSIMPHYTCPLDGAVYYLDGARLTACCSPEAHRCQLPPK